MEFTDTIIEEPTIKKPNIFTTIFESKVKTLLLLLTLSIVVVIIVLAICTGVNLSTYLNIFSSYSDALADGAATFFSSIKSWSNVSNKLLEQYSIFSSTNYVPFDPISLFLFIFNKFKILNVIGHYIRLICGICLTYYVLNKNGSSIKQSFVISLFILVGALIQAYYVAPAFLGIYLLIPSGMLIVDIAMTKKRFYYFLVPGFSLLALFYDINLGYISTFFCFAYYLTILYKNGDIKLNSLKFLKNKIMWQKIGFFALILFAGLGVGIWLLLILSVGLDYNYASIVPNMFIPSDSYYTDMVMIVHSVAYALIFAFIVGMYLYCTNKENRKLMSIIILSYTSIITIIILLLCLISIHFTSYFIILYYLTILLADYVIKTEEKLTNTFINVWNKLWSRKLSVFIMLTLVLSFVLIVVVAYTNYLGGFLNMASDDILQYYPYVAGFIEKIKRGTLSLYDVNLLGGASFFSGVYYIPIDIFTFITLIMSYMIPTETAYAITNFMRPMCGAMILYYVLIRKNIKPKTAFIAALIYFCGGVTEAYYIFPVYLGVCFYAPLAMLVVDLAVHKKGAWYLLIPIYSVTIIFYDFYISYMLFAFICVYYVIEMHITNNYSFFGKNSFIKNLHFWKSFLEFFFLLFLGIGMALCFMLPSALYVINESSRNAPNSELSIWIFKAYVDGKESISWRHYFTQICNLFIPNEPHRFCLIEAGDYMREHASLYMTSGGALYLAYFFFTWGQKENRLKIWVVLLNILFCIPLAAMIFTFNSIPYSRWFFIPYLINFYAMVIAMDRNNFKVSKHNLIQIAPMVLLTIGLSILIYVVIADPKIFIHYNKSDPYFYPILIGSIAFISIYLILLIIAFVIRFKGYEAKRIYKIIPLVIFAECIFATGVIFTNVGNTNDYYYNAKNEMKSQKDHLYTLGYNDTDGYRINLHTFYGKDSLNGNILVGNVNFGRFFQSFYNTPLNTIMSDVYNEDSKHWGRDFHLGYSMVSANLFNVKYVVSHDYNNLNLPTSYYKTLDTHQGFTYYELINCPQFIVYDDVYIYTKAERTNNSSQMEAFERELSLLNHGYVYNPLDYDETVDILTDEDKEHYEMYEYIKESGIEFVKASAVKQSLSDYNKLLISNPTVENIGGSTYYKYKILEANKQYLSLGGLYVYSYNADVRRMIHDDIYLIDSDGNKVNFHYNIGFPQYDESKDYELVMKVTDENSTKQLRLYAFDFTWYDNFLAKQATYKDKYYKLDGDKMYIKCTMPSDDKVRIIKTAYTYSEDWKVTNPEYKTCNIDGGFLGIIVPEGTTSVDILVNYVPAGYTEGCIISGISCIIYLGITIPIVTVIIVKKVKKKNKKEVL